MRERREMRDAQSNSLSTRCRAVVDVIGGGGGGGHALGGVFSSLG